MELQFFAHGVPYGADFWGKDKSEYDFFKSLYNTDNTTTPGIRMMIYARDIGQKRYWYYSYMVGGNIKSVERDGSYFGMTLRLSDGCTEFKKIYSIMDMAFQVHVLGKILMRIPSGYQYINPNFEDVDSNFVDIYNVIHEQLGNILTPKVMMRSNTIPVSKYSYQPINVSDMLDNEVLEKLRKGYKVIISSLAPTLREHKLKQDHAKIEEKLRKEFEKKYAKISKTSSESININNEPSLEISNKEIHKPNIELANTFRTTNNKIDSINESPAQRRKLVAGMNNKMFTIVNTVLLLLILIIQSCRTPQSNGFYIDKLQMERIMSILEKIEQQNVPNEGNEEATNESNEEVSTEASEDFKEGDNIKINIVGYTGSGPLENKKYPLQIIWNGKVLETSKEVGLNDKNLEGKLGYWDVSGADITIDQNNKIIIEPNEDKVNISFKDKRRKVIQSRLTIDVKH